MCMLKEFKSATLCLCFLFSMMAYNEDYVLDSRSGSRH